MTALADVGIEQDQGVGTQTGDDDTLAARAARAANARRSAASTDTPTSRPVSTLSLADRAAAAASRRSSASSAPTAPTMPFRAEEPPVMPTPKVATAVSPTFDNALTRGAKAAPALTPAVQPAATNPAPVAANAPAPATNPGPVATAPYFKNGHTVVDTARPDDQGHVPTHRLDQPTNRQPGETFPQYEDRVLAQKSFSPDTAQRADLSSLQPDVQSAAKSMIDAAKSEGISLSPAETKRTQERQEMLFQKGRSTPGSTVTWTLTSDHTPGRAIDFNGDEKTFDWLQKNASKYGFSTMGAMDPGHVAMPTAAAPPPTQRLGAAVPPVRPDATTAPAAVRDPSTGRLSMVSGQPNPSPTHLPEPVASIAKFGLDPMLNNPLQTAVMGATGAGGAALATGGMVKDLVDFGSQKAAESTLPPDVKKLAEQDPTRISGKQAAVEGGLLAAPLLLHGGARALGKAADVSEGVMEAGAKGAKAATRGDVAQLGRAIGLTPKGEAPPPIAAPDLTTPEVNKIAETHDLGDLVAQNTKLLTAQEPTANASGVEDIAGREDIAARNVVSRYRDLTHGGMDAETAKRTIAADHATVADDPSIAWSGDEPPGADAVETLAQRAERAAIKQRTMPTESTNGIDQAAVEADVRKRAKFFGYDEDAAVKLYRDEIAAKPTETAEAAETADRSPSSTESDVAKEETPATNPAPPEGHAPTSVPSLRGDEFGDPSAGMNAIRARATAHAKENLIGKSFHNDANNWDVTISRQAIDHTTHPKTTENWHASILALHALPDLIREGELTASEPTRGGADKVRDIPMHHRLEAPFEVDGKPYVAQMTLREQQQLGAKRLYHVRALTVEPVASGETIEHAARTETQKPGVSAERPNPRNATSWSQPPEETPGSLKNVAPTVPEAKSPPEAAPPAADDDGIEYRNIGISPSPKLLRAAHVALSEAVTDPNAAIVKEHPELARAISSANAMTPTQGGTFVRQLGERVVHGLTPEQREQFGQRIRLDNHEAEAVRKEQSAKDAEVEHTTRIDGLQQRVDAFEADEARLRKLRAAATKTATKSQSKAATQQRVATAAKATAADIQAVRDKALAPGATHADLTTAVGDADTAAGKAERALDAATDRRADLQRASRDAERTLNAANKAVASLNDRIQRMRLNADGESSAAMEKLPELIAEREAKSAEGNAAMIALQHADDALPDAHSEVERLAKEAEDAADRHAELRDAFSVSLGGGDANAKAAAAAAQKAALRLKERIARTAASYLTDQIDHTQRGAGTYRDAIRKAQGEMQEHVGALRQAVKNHTEHADALRTTVPANVEQQPWFQAAIKAHRETVQPFMDAAAEKAGVDASTFRSPSLGVYSRLIPTERLSEPLIRRAQSIAAGEGEGATTPRTGLARRLLGQKRGVLMSSPDGTETPMQGPVDIQRETPGGSGASVAGTKQSASAQMATGAAREYSNDYLANLRYDATDKVSKAAHNQVFQAIAKAAAANPNQDLGKIFELGPDRNAPPGMRTLAFNDSKEIIDDPAPGDVIAKVRRFAVPKEVGDAVDRYRAKYTYPSAAGRAVRGAMGAVTKSVLLNPMVAGTHTLTLASSVGTGIPAEARLGGVASGLPGAKMVSTIARMRGVDFADPATAERLTRLAFNGALRIGEDQGGGALDAGHHFLFGPKGMDTRARLVASEDVEAALRQSGITPSDPRFAGLERKYVVEHAGNYVSRNQGVASKWLQDNGIAPFVAINRAKIGTSLKALVGSDGTIAPTAARRLGLVFRGPIGAASSIAAASYLLSGHSPSTNAPGHEGDLATGVYHTPDGKFLYFRGDPTKAVAQFGKGTKEVYLRRGILDPTSEAALRVLQPMVVANQGSRVYSVLRGATNTALGMVGPGAGAAFGLATGKSLYLDNDGNFASIDKPHLAKDQAITDRLVAAARNANAGASLALPPQGDQPRNGLGRPLVNVLSEGNPTARQGQERHDVQLWTQDVVGRIHQATTRVDRETIMREALDEAAQQGYTGPGLRMELQKAVNKADRDRSAVTQRKFENRIRGGTSQP